MRSSGLSTHCRWCARLFFECNRRGCLTPETKIELNAYALRHGRTWRSRLRNEWTAGSATLREVRNTVGPTRLAKVRPSAMTESRDLEVSRV